VQVLSLPVTASTLCCRRRPGQNHAVFEDRFGPVSSRRRPRARGGRPRGRGRAPPTQCLAGAGSVPRNQLADLAGLRTGRAERTSVRIASTTDSPAGRRRTERWAGRPGNSWSI
jgi:hypothetical protein